MERSRTGTLNHPDSCEERFHQFESEANHLFEDVSDLAVSIPQETTFTNRMLAIRERFHAATVLFRQDPPRGLGGMEEANGEMRRLGLSILEAMGETPPILFASVSNKLAKTERKEVFSRYQGQFEEALASLDLPAAARAFRSIRDFDRELSAKNLLSDLLSGIGIQFSSPEG